MMMDRLSSSLLWLLLAVPLAAACGDDDDDHDHDDDGDGTTIDASTSDAATPDGGGSDGGLDAALPDGGPLADAAPVPDAAPEIDAAPPGPGLIWIHGDMITNGRNQLAAIGVGGELPATPVVVVPGGETGTLATFQSVNSGAYDISNDGQRVALPADIEVPGRYDLYAGPVDGSELTRLFTASGFTSVGKARISPNGSRIAFSADIDADGVFAAYVVSATVPDSTPLRVSPVDGTDDVDDIIWSNDSRYIMVTGDFTEAAFFELYVTDVTAGNPTPVRLISRADILSTQASAGVIRPIVARDGQVVFKGRIAADNAVRLHRVPLAGGAVTVLPQSELPRTDGTTIADYGAVGVSPDGTQIAFAADETERVYDVWAMPASGSEPPTRLTTGLVPPADPIQVINPDFGQLLKWSPDAQQIAFTADYVTVNQNDVFVAPLDGSGQRRVADVGPDDPAADAEAVAWSPDGTLLYMVADHQTPNQVELFVLDPTLVDQPGALVFGVTAGGDLRGDITVSNN